MCEAGDVTEEKTYNFKLFAKYPVEGENWNGRTACCSITVYPAYQGRCFEAEGEYPRPTFAIGTSTSLFTVTHSGGASPVGPLTLAITAVPTDATPATLPPAISFTSPVADDPRTGTLSGLDADETPPAIGIYTYSLSAVDKLLHTHTVTDCEFEVVPKYEVACFAAESGDPTPTFAVGGAEQSFVVEATGGADPIGTPLTFTLTSRPPEAPASPDMPPDIGFLADGRKGTLSGKATDAAFKGDYKYSLSTTDRLGNVASVQDCIFKVLASDLFTTGCTYTIGTTTLSMATRWHDKRAGSPSAHGRGLAALSWPRPLVVHDTHFASACVAACSVAAVLCCVPPPCVYGRLLQEQA